MALARVILITAVLGHKVALVPTRSLELLPLPESDCSALNVTGRRLVPSPFRFPFFFFFFKELSLSKLLLWVLSWMDMWNKSSSLGETLHVTCQVKNLLSYCAKKKKINIAPLLNKTLANTWTFCTVLHRMFESLYIAVLSLFTGRQCPQFMSCEQNEKAELASSPSTFFKGTHMARLET